MDYIDNLDSLKQLYESHFNEEDVIEVTNLKGRKFYMVGQPNPTILDAGYIILKDGKFIKIDQSQDHDNVLSYFLTLYMELPMLNEFGSGEAAKLLNSFGLPVYFGIKSRYLGELESKGIMENYSLDFEINSLERQNGTFILSLPDNDSSDNLTLEQKKSIQILLKSYDEIRAKTDMPFDFVIGNIEKGLTYSEDEVNKLIALQDKTKS